MRGLTKILNRDKYLMLLILPVLIYYLIFHYVPMYGIMLAFIDFHPMKGFFESQWVGFAHFEAFFNSIYFWRLIKNTILLSFYFLLWGFPIPIIFALLLNELKEGIFKKAVQTVSYIPHFISVVVVAGMILSFTSVHGGIVNQAIGWFGIEPINFMGEPRWFRTIFISSSIWQSFGWSSIIYLAAISGVNPQLYEAAEIDGANRWQKMGKITLPCLMPTVIILLILAVGQLMEVGVDKIILLYSPQIYETADVISTFVYRRGIENADYSYSAAIGLFNNVINLILLIAVNRLSRKISETSLW